MAMTISNHKEKRRASPSRASRNEETRDWDNKHHKTDTIKDEDNSGGDLGDDDLERIHNSIVGAWFAGKEIDSRNGELRSTEDGQNLIHKAITALKKRKYMSLKKVHTTQPGGGGDNSTIFPKQALDGIESLVLRKPSLFTEADFNKEVPMIESLKLDVSVLIKVINLLIPHAVREQLRDNNTTCRKEDQGSCPLSKVAAGRKNQCQKELKGGKIDPRSRGHHRCSTYPHVDVPKVLEEDEKLRNVLRTALDTEKLANRCLAVLLVEKHFDDVSKEKGKLMPLEGFKTLLKLCPDGVFESPPSALGQLTPLQKAVSLYKSPLIACDYVLSIIDALIERCPSSIFLRTGDTGNTNTAYDLLKNLDDTKFGEKSRKDAQELLKRACVGYERGKRDGKKDSDADAELWAEKREFLYGNTKSKMQFFFSLKGAKACINEEYIEHMSTRSGIEFDTVLAFVELPYWEPVVVPSPVKPQLKPQSPDPGVVEKGDAEEESDPYLALFRWLWECEVRKIFKLDVDDDGTKAHTNAAIREALRGTRTNRDPTRDFEIEIWNWKKFDICADTVALAAPSAREVHLYSRGNTAVLRGWACGGSLSKLEKLEKLYIDIYPQNPNDDEDCEQYMEELKNGIKRQCPGLNVGDIHAVNHSHRAKGDNNDDEENREKNSRETKLIREIKAESEWLNALRPFTNLLNQLNRDLSAEKRQPVVRIALLDDGCALRVLDSQAVQYGKSFRSVKENYFDGVCSHGTEMAICIRKVCPPAELVIARLGNHEEKNQAFSIKACCKALEYAIEMDVDIISMSWSFEISNFGKYEDGDKKMFRELVEKALGSGKVLFGALPDKLVETKLVAPARLPGVIKIGSATAYGERSPTVKLANPDFILPGEDIDLSSGGRAKGSSFATAFAAGLAASVLYCLKLCYNEEISDSKDRAAAALAMAKTRDGMVRIFNVLSGLKRDESKGEGRFVQPYKVVRVEGRRLDSVDEKVDFIKEVALKILP